MIFTSNVLKRWYFQRGSYRDMIFFVISGKVVFFPPKTWYFFPGRKTKEEWPFARYTRKHDIFYLICLTPPAKKKNQRGSYPAKIHLKVINISDWYPRKSSRNILYLHGDLYRRFHIYCSLAKKIRKLNI